VSIKAGQGLDVLIGRANFHPEAGSTPSFVDLELVVD
jgi:hypothetical protein